MISEGTAHRAEGDLEGAIAAFRDAVAAAPERAEAHLNLGDALRRAGYFEDALASLHAALALDPMLAFAELGVGAIHSARGALDKAVEAYHRALRIDPGNVDILVRFTDTVRPLVPTRYEPSLDPELIACFRCSEIHHNDLSQFTAKHLCLKHHLDGEPPDAAATGALIEAIAGDELFCLYLERTINPNIVLERALTACRRTLLGESPTAAWLDSTRARTAAAIAHQCFSNEFLFAEESEETRAVETLADTLKAPGVPREEPDEMQGRILLYAMYRPVHRLACAPGLEQIPRARWHRYLRSLIARVIHAPLEEAAIAADVESLGDISNEVSLAVRAQYEENPYPRWTSIPRRPRRRLASMLRQEFPHFEPTDALRGHLDMLVAGCGTGQHSADIATHYEDTSVLAVDLSRNSLAHAIRATRQLGIDNVFYMQADVANLARLEGNFQVIECVGVLMLLESPEDGLRTLYDLLVPGGLLKLGLYSTLARTLVVEGRRRIAELGLTPRTEQIKDYRQRIINGLESPELQEFMRSREFYTLSNVRDLLFAPGERSFTLLEVAEMLDALGLRFIGFSFPDQDIRGAYHREFPEDSCMDSLSGWHEFELRHPETFRGMYQFWCLKPE